MLGIDGEYPPERQISLSVVQNCEKSAVKHSRGKPILNFVNLSAIFSPRLSTKVKSEVFNELHLPVQLLVKVPCS